MIKNILLILLIFILPLQAKTIKCWINRDGFKECRNSLLPEYVKQRIELLSEKNAQIIEVKEPKTKQQLLAEQKQKKILDQYQQQLAKQKVYDNVLLKTYLTIDDLFLSLKWKITELNSRIIITHEEIRKENKVYLDYISRAAKMERSGKKLSNEIKSNLKTSRNHIKNLEQKIILLEKDKKDIHDKFSYDVDRFTIATINGFKLTLKDDKKAQKIKMIQVTCKEENECNQMWASAKEFVDTHLKQDIMYETDHVYTTKSPNNESDMALTVSRVSSSSYKKTSELISLKIRCYPSRTGEKLCKSSTMSDQLKNFKKMLIQSP